MKLKVNWLKRILAVWLSVTMLTGMGIPGAESSYLNVVHASEIGTEFSAESEESTVSGNAVKETAVRNGTILQVFCWNFKTMIENMEDIANAGYTAIQTSPINACVDTNPALTLSGDGMWYYHYQPTDWTIGNYQLGTRDEFIEMCAVAEEYGIQVIVDILPNHTASNRSTVSQSLIDAAGDVLDDLYHETGLLAMENYADRFQCTYYAMGGLPDVDTENEGFQQYFYDYLKDCIACGADGFRIDTAKHIALPDDPVPEGEPEDRNDFYPNMYDEVTSQNDLFVYGEVLQGANERLGAYQKAIGGTTASSYGGAIRSALVDNDYSVSDIRDYHIEEDATPSKLVTWVESHDNYINDGTAGLLDEEQVKLGWAIITARKEGSPLFFSRPMGSSKENMWGENKIGIAGSDIYKDDEVAAVNKFRTAMVGEEEYLRNPNENAQVIMIERGNKGVTIVNGSYSDYALDSATNLADGTYMNMTDDNSVFTVADGTINGILPARSVVVLYEKASTEATTVLFYNSELWSSVSASVNGSEELISATNDGDGWWRVTVPADIAIGFTIAFTNGTDTSEIFTISEQSGRYVTGANGTVYPSKSAAEEAVGIEKTSVYLLNSAVWDTVYGYSWIGSNQLFGEWPGTTAVYEGDYWWRIDVPATASDELFVIFNNNNGTQTENININNATDVYVTNTTTEKYASKEAAETAAGVSSDLTTVYYYNSKAWSDVYTYTWGNGEALGSWPGTKAEDIGNGWWKMVIPTGAGSELNVIFNNGKSDADADKQQAANIVVSNIRDVYLTYNGEKYASIAAAEEALGLSSTETKVYYYDNLGWETTYAYAKSISTGEEYLGEWPGTAMTEDYNGWQGITIPSGVSDDLQVVFNNGTGSQEDGIQFIVNDRAKVYLTGDGNSYTNKIEAETALGVELSVTTVYFYNCDEWEEVCAYVYGGNLGEAFGGWPGRAATNEGNGWWSVQVPGLVSDGFTIIFNNNNNQSQSKDIPMTDQSKVYTTNGTTTTFGSKEEVEAYIAELRSSIDVYYYDTEGWTTTYVYAKSKANGTEYLGAWPGTAMVEDSNGWRVVAIQAPASDDLEVIFSNGETAEGVGNTFTVNDRTKLYLTGKDDTAYTGKIEAEKALGVELSTTTVYFYNGAGWSSVNAYAWIGDNQFLGGWPGSAATDEGDGWWSIELEAVPAADLFIIFNGDGGQTANLNVTDAKKLYVTNAGTTFYSSKEEAMAALEALSGETDVYFYNTDNWETVSVHAWTGAGNVTGDWPGMTATDMGDGWWKATVPAGATSGLSVIFNNGGNGIQTGDYVISDATKVYAIKETTVLFGSKEQAEEMSGILQGETDVYFYNGDNWDTVNAYAWVDDVKLFGEWPGINATDEGDGWWKITLPSSVSSKLFVIFNNGNGAQTENLNVTDANKPYVTNEGTTFYGTKEEAEGIPEGIWLAGLEEAGYVYTGTAIKPEVCVYDYKTLLEKNKDYTITYKNNTKVYTLAEGDEGFKANKAPQIIVKGKGNYSDTLVKYFTIEPKNISDEDVEVTYTSDFIYNKKNVTPLSKITYNGKKVSASEYSVAYFMKNEDGSYATVATKVKEVGTYKMVITGKDKNFTGSVEKEITVHTTEGMTYLKDMVIAVEGSTKPYSTQYTGSAIEPKVTVTPKGKNQAPLSKEAYSVKWDNNVSVGTGTITITGNAKMGVIGTVTKTFKITGLKLNSVAKVDDKATLDGEVIWKKTVPYDIKTGRAIQKVDENGKNLVPLTAKSTKNTDLSFAEGVDYEVSYKKNDKPGTATMVFTGIGKYTGTITKTFKITKINFADAGEKLTVIPEAETGYVKKGSKINIEVTYDGVTLEEGKHYKVSYSNNKAVTTSATAEKKLPKATITGSGVFTGKVADAITFGINKADLSNLNVTASDVVYKNSKGKFMAVPVVTDVNGTKLTNNKDYSCSYFLVVDSGDGEVVKTPVTKDNILPKDSVVEVVVTAKEKSNYVGSNSTTYEVKEFSITKASVKIKHQEYTGKEVKITGDDFEKIKVGSVTLYEGTDYKILDDSYENNVNKGTATVIIEGRGNYGGTKKVTFKITSQKLNWWEKLLP